MRRRPRLSAARERDTRAALRLDNPGPGAQPQGVRRDACDHEEMLDRAVILAPRRVLLGAADLHEVEPQADHRLFPGRQSRAAAGGCAGARRSRHVLGRQSSAGDHHDTEGVAGLPAAGAKAAPTIVGAVDQRPLAQVCSRAGDQRRDDRRTQRPPAPQPRDLLRGGGKGWIPRHAQPRPIQVRVGRREAARDHDQPLPPHHPPWQGKGDARTGGAGARAAVRLLRTIRLRRCGGTARRADGRPQPESDGADAAGARNRDPRLQAICDRHDHEDENGVRLRRFLLPRLVRTRRLRAPGDRGADADFRRGGDAGDRARMWRQGRAAGARARSGGVSGAPSSRLEEETMASKQTEALNALYRGWAAALQANQEMPLDEMRLMLEQWGNITGEPRGVDYIETSAGEVPALWAAPKNCAEDRVLLCAHGGGYVAASMYTHRKTYGHVAKATGCRALIVDYRRAPENVHPGPVNDMVRSYIWLLDQGIRPNHVAVIGDSAGGGLAVTTILCAREQGLPLPAATMPLSPWLDMEATGETFETNAAKDVI